MNSVSPPFKASSSRRCKDKLSFQKTDDNFAVAVYFLQNTHNLVISRFTLRTENPLHLITKKKC